MKTPSKKQFAEWLKAKGRRRVGIGRSGDSCPIATILMEMNPDAMNVGVCSDGLALAFIDDGESKAPPAWMTKFINEIDAQLEDNPITGNRALEVLEAIK